MRTLFLGLVVALSLGGCGGVFSRQPASEADSIVDDDRLIGIWRVDATATKGVAGEVAAEPAILVVGRRSAGSAELDAAWISLRKDETIDSSRADLAATRIVEKGYASLRPRKGEPADGEATWAVVRYDMPDIDTLRVLAMNEDVVAGDVREKAIEGAVTGGGGGVGAKEGATTVTLSVSTSALREYLARRKDAIYATDRPLVLKRLRGP